MTETVFFSWQADTPTRVGRNFIREALEEVCRGIASDTSVDEALRDMRVDSDTQNVAGQPPIVDTIFKKIDASRLFVGDMTFVGTRVAGERAPNPNVLIEYGWALKSKTHERVILLMNTSYGEPSEQSLPFNLRHLRWPITFRLPDDTPPAEKAKVKAKLVNDLKRAIRASLATLPVTPDSEPKPFPQAAEKNGLARFRALGEALGITDEGFPLSEEREVKLTEGPAIWMRLMPVIDTGRRWSAPELKIHALADGRINFISLSRGSGANFLRADDGWGMFSDFSRMETKDSDPIEANWVTFVFETGEVWAIDTFLLTVTDILPFIEDRFMGALTSYSQFLERLGLRPPFRWIAGLTGVKGRKMMLPPPPPGRTYFETFGPKCVADDISAEGTYDGIQTPASALRPLFHKFFEKCGCKRPDHLPQ